MDQTSFQTWRDAHPFIEDSLFYPEGEDCRWVRIEAKWNEKGKDLNHLCAFTLDIQTGDIYLDCRKRKIWAKFSVLCLARPFFGLVKTAYHVILPISIPLEIFKAVIEGYQEGHSAKEIATRAWCNIKHNVTDIVRTPLYTIILQIVTLAAVFIAPFYPSKLYDLRALAGRLENALNRGQEAWTLAPCFQPLDNIMTIHLQNYQKADTEYEDEPTLQGLNNLARNYVKFRRENRNIFDNCGRLQPEETSYVSAVYSH